MFIVNADGTEFGSLQLFTRRLLVVSCSRIGPPRLTSGRQVTRTTVQGHIYIGYGPVFNYVMALQWNLAIFWGFLQNIRTL